MQCYLMCSIVQLTQQTSQANIFVVMLSAWCPEHFTTGGERYCTNIATKRLQMLGLSFQVSLVTFVCNGTSNKWQCDKLSWCVADLGSNNSGYYRLQAVLTHRGRSSSSGHYVAWVHQKGDVWLKCDDDQVSPVTSEEVLKLSGGGKYRILGTFYVGGETSWKAQLKIWVSVKKDLAELVLKMWTGLVAVVGFNLAGFCNETVSSNTYDFSFVHRYLCQRIYLLMWTY